MFLCVLDGNMNEVFCLEIEHFFNGVRYCYVHIFKKRQGLSSMILQTVVVHSWQDFTAASSPEKFYQMSF